MQFLKLSLVVAALISGHASAAGFELAETSATGLGRAFAGAAAIADNASSQARNAAMLLALDGMQVSGGMVYIDPNVDSDGTVSYFNPVTMEFQQINADANELIPTAVVPNFYFSHKLNDKWAYGVGITSNYGLTSELPQNDHPASFLGNKIELITAEFNPNVAYAIDENYSIGFGLRVVYADGELNGYAPNWTDGLNEALVGVGAAPAYPSSGTLLRELSGDDIALAYNLGFHWQSNNGHSVGLAYHSEVDLELEGDYSAFNGLGYSAQGGSMDVTLPAFAELAAATQLTPELRLSASAKWTQWSEYGDLLVDLDDGSDALLKKEEFEDNWRFAVGIDYRLDQRWLWRGGFAYDESAVDNEHRTLSIPDSSRFWFSSGVAYEYSSQLTVDLSVTYLTATGDGEIHEEEEALGAVYDGEVEGGVWLVGAQLSYRF